MASIVICSDGTWDSADQDKVDGQIIVSNVLKIACRLKKVKADGSRQIVYYDQGVGTRDVFDKIGGGAFGDGLEANVNDAYRFLIANYEPGDCIYLFGFSRGAYTARSIAGMIRHCGILRRDTVRQYPEAKALYLKGTKPDDPEAVKFRTDYAIEPDTPIQCVGVWDTVGALGIPVEAFAGLNEKKYQFLDTGLSRVVKFAFHALAIDEHRKPFLPTLWTTAPDPAQTVRQVWFAGAHSDVGGGYQEHGLSDIVLDWMMDSAKTAGLEVDDAVRKALGTIPSYNPDYKQDVHISLKGAAALLGGADRQVGATNFNTEYFHRSLVERWRERQDYRPKPLQPHAARLNALVVAPVNDEIYPVA